MSKYTILEPIGASFDKPLTVPMKPVLIITDTHAPYQHTELLMKAFDIAKAWGIKHLIHAGDLINADSYNSQSKGEIVTNIDIDIEHARSILYYAQQFFSIYLLPGNHDNYYLKKEKITFDTFIRTVVMQDRLTRKIRTTEYDYLFYGNFAIIGHPSGYDMTPGKLAAGLADKYNMHALIGHDHIRGMLPASNGKYGISIGGMFMHNSFWYKERSYNLFPHSNGGFVIIKDKKIHHFDEQLREDVYE